MRQSLIISARPPGDALSQSLGEGGQGVRPVQLQRHVENPGFERARTALQETPGLLLRAVVEVGAATRIARVIQAVGNAGVCWPRM